MPPPPPSPSRWKPRGPTIRLPLLFLVLFLFSSRFAFVPTAATAATAATAVTAATATATAPSRAIRHWGKAQDADLDLVLAIAQTPDGYLWLGSPSGLRRGNGHTFVSVDPRPHANETTSALSVTTLLVDRLGALWIGTEFEGLYRLHRGQSRTFRSNEGLTNDRIKCLLQRADGSVLAGTDGGGLFVLPPDHDLFRPFPLPANLQLTHPTALAETPDGLLWIGTFSNGLLAVRESDLAHSFPKIATVKSLLPRRNGELWIATVSGVARIHEDSLQHVPLATAQNLGRAASFVTSLAEDREGDLWIATLRGLVQLSPTNEVRRGTDHGLGNGLITALFRDRENSIWAGSEIGGLHQLHPAPLQLWPPYPHPQPGPQACHALALGTNGWLWIAGSQGVVAWHNRHPVWTPPPHSAAAREALAIATGRDGRIWFGGRDKNWGVIENHQVRAIPLTDPHLATQVANVILDSKSHGLLVGTARGLRRVSPTLDVLPTPEFDVPPTTITDLLETPDASLWIGSGRGLFRHRSDHTEHLVSLADRPLEVVHDLLPGPDHSLWIATSRGLWRWHQDRLFAFTQSHGLPGLAAPLVSDPSSNLWAGTGSSLAQIPLHHLLAVANGQTNRIPHPRLWTRADGFDTTLPANGRGALTTPDGHLQFVTDTGIATLFLPGPNPLPPLTEPRIETVSINGETLDWSLLRYQPSPPSQLTLPAGYNLVEFTFVAPTFRAPDRVIYAPRLRGLSDSWETATTARSVTYRALPPGDYLFELRAIDPDGQQTSSSDQVRFHVLAHWWQLPRTRVVAALGFSLLLASAYALRIRRLERLAELHRRYSRRLLEHEENERRRLAQELHDGLGQDLLLVKNQILLLERHPPGPSDDFRQRLQTISASSQRAIDQARSLAHNLRPAELDRIGLTASLDSMLDRVATGTQLVIHRHLEPLDGVLAKDREVMLYRISQELLTNTAKHARARNLHVRLTRPEPTRVELEIADDGCGFTAAALDAPTRVAGGLGLDNVRERVEMLRGTVELVSHPGSGTRWRVRVPVT